LSSLPASDVQARPTHWRRSMRPCAIQPRKPATITCDTRTSWA
jgi:hypothetical protein